MSMIRAFIALEIPPGLQDEIAQASAGLKQKLGDAVRWVAPHNLHLTLKFLGDVPRPGLDALTAALGVELGRLPLFDLTLADFGVFPNPKRPRVLWVGVQAPPDLERLRRVVESCAARLGVAPEDKKPFSAHLTIGRVRETADPAGLQAALQDFRPGRLGAFTAEGLRLFRSDLRPQGPIYTSLALLPLARENFPETNEVTPESA
jgi:RNA 2',3'-cyclic 3'-phosphodiesterase